MEIGAVRLRPKIRVQRTETLQRRRDLLHRAGTPKNLRLVRPVPRNNSLLSFRQPRPTGVTSPFLLHQPLTRTSLLIRETGSRRLLLPLTMAGRPPLPHLL